MERKYSLQQILVLVGGIGGLAAGLYIGLHRFGLFGAAQDPAAGPQPPTADAAVGQTAFLLVFVLPFVMSLLALRSQRPQAHAVAWIGTGLFGLLATIFSFSAATRLLLPLPSILLLAAGSMAFLRPDVEKSLAVIVLALGLVVVGGGAFFTLFTQEDPVCWAQLRSESGQDIWEERPAGTADPIVLNDPAVGDIVGWTCTSDVISRQEGWYSLGIWAVGLAAGSFLLTRRGFAG